MAQDYTPDCYGASHLAQTDLANMEKNHECHRTNFSGADSPANPVAGMWWLDTANHLLKQRNEANDAWISWFDLSTGKLVAAAAPNADEKVKAASGDPAAGYLDAKVDGSTIEVFANALRVKTGGLTGLQCAAIAAGNDLFLEAPTERYTAAETYTKIKEITVNRAGSIRVTFELRSMNDTYSVAARVYKNGTAVGTAFSTTQETYQTAPAEDFAGIAAGDKIQLYAKKTTAVMAYVRNFRILVSGDPIRGIIDTD